MSSSISGSKRAALTYVKALLGICALVIIGLEISSYYLLDHFSLTYSRISQQYERALTMRRATPGEPPSVLIVGNSLLLHGIQLDRLRSLTSGSMQIYPIFLEATGYYDWLFGLRKIFDEGARPDVVVLGVGVNYFLSNHIRPDYTPMQLVDARDVPALASDLHLDNTEKSDLWLSHLSAFWDTRSAIRMQILKHFVPHLEDLFDLLTPRPGIPQGHPFAAIALPRLQSLQKLCETHGARLILLVPPTLGSEGAVSEMADAARMAGVEVSVPVDPAALSTKFFESDGMHLNREGAVVFTAALSKDLPAHVAVQNTLAYRSQAPTEQEVSVVDPKKPSHKAGAHP
jgi:hypothetical protein